MDGSNQVRNFSNNMEDLKSEQKCHQQNLIAQFGLLFGPFQMDVAIVDKTKIAWDVIAIVGQLVNKY